ncbi:FliG C-terminal domain-containing protein [Buchnera aphidicola]|uniref:FliG C-terminal domain-containing protein n=1 Tax=Buchnera aphidicola TaxID=9 RepID=UPI0034641D34
MILNGIFKSAILLILIGSEQSLKIFKFFSEIEKQHLLDAILEIQIVTEQDVNNLYHHFIELYHKNVNDINLDSKNYIKNLISNVYQKSNEKLYLENFIKKKLFFEKIHQLNDISSKLIYRLLKNENLNIISTILFFLDHHHTAEIISYFSNENQSEIICLISNFSGLKPSRINDFIKIIDLLLLNQYESYYQNINTKRVLNIINYLDKNRNMNTVDKIYRYNKNIRYKILYKIFSFQNVIYLTDISILTIVKNIDRNHLMIALYKADDTVKRKFFKNVSYLEDMMKQLEFDKDRYISNDVIFNSQNIIVTKIRKLLKKKKISMINVDS